MRVRTLYSGISAGTELTAYRGSNPYLGRRWDAGRRLFVDGSPAHPYPWEGPGYESVGEVVELGSEVTGLQVGDRIWGTWGHRSSTVIPADGAAERRLPEGMDAIRGVFARIGAIALNGVLDADVHVGEHVAVFGLGVPGLIATRLAVLSGATVAAVDRIGRRLELAGAMGAAHVIDGRRSRRPRRSRS